MAKSTQATLADIERAITDLGYGTPEYHEAMAMYCLTLARGQWRMADQARARREKAARRRHG